MWGPPNIKRLSKRKDVNRLIAALHYRKSGEIRKAAAQALGATNDPRAVEPLLALLSAGSWHAPEPERLMAITALGKLRDTRATKPLLEVLEGIRYGLTHETERDVVQRVVRALAEIEGPEIIAMILPPWEFGSLPPSTLPEAMLVIGPNVAVAQMTGSLTDGNKDVRKGAASALERMAVEMDSETVHRLTFQQCEFLFRDPLIVDALLYVYKNEGDDEVMRSAAITALAKSKDPRVAGAVRESLTNVDDLWAQKRAARALAEFGDREAIPFLVNALEVRNSPGRRAIAEALDRLGWEPSSDSDRAWRMVSLAEWSRDVQNLAACGAKAISPEMALWSTEWATGNARGCLIVQDALCSLLERYAAHFAPADLALLAMTGDPMVRHETSPDSGQPEVSHESADISRVRKLAGEELQRRGFEPHEALRTSPSNISDA